MLADLRKREKLACVFAFELGELFGKINSKPQTLGGIYHMLDTATTQTLPLTISSQTQILYTIFDFDNNIPMWSFAQKMVG